MCPDKNFNVDKDPVAKRLAAHRKKVMQNPGKAGLAPRNYDRQKG